MAVFETVPRLDAAPNGAGRILCAEGSKYAAPTELALEPVDDRVKSPHRFELIAFVMANTFSCLNIHCVSLRNETILNTVSEAFHASLPSFCPYGTVLAERNICGCTFWTVPDERSSSLPLASGEFVFFLLWRRSAPSSKCFSVRHTARKKESLAS